jgi:hypothetical protein
VSAAFDKAVTEKPDVQDQVSFMYGKEQPGEARAGRATLGRPDPWWCDYADAGGAQAP